MSYDIYADTTMQDLSVGKDSFNTTWSTNSLFELGGTGLMATETTAAAGTSLITANNAYYDGSNYKYIVTDEASRIIQKDGEIYLDTAPSGTAGTNITFTNRILLRTNGATDINGVHRILGGTSPTTGVGVETNYVGSVGQLFAYDRDTPGYKSLLLNNSLTIDSVGNAGLGTTVLGSRKLTVQHGTNSQLIGLFDHTGSTPFGLTIDFSAAAPNNGTQYFLQCEDSSATRFVLRSDGGLANFQTNDVNLSDERLKTAIVPAENQLDMLCQLQVKEFEYRDAPGRKVLGLIAQQVEMVDPALVDDAFTARDENGDEFMAKSIRTTELYHKMLKAIQELAEKNSILEARIGALEA